MDELIFNDIYDKYVNAVWKTEMYYSGDKTNADEVTQLTFIKLMLNYDKIKNKDAIESWLLTTARHLAYSQIRKRKMETPMHDTELRGHMNGTGAGSEEVIFMKEHRRKESEFVNGLLEELYHHNSKWYDAVVNAYALEIPQKEIAEEMGIRLEAFQSMLFRAKKWIKAKYEAEYREMK